MLRAVMSRIIPAIPRVRFAMAPGPYSARGQRDALGILTRLPMRKRSIDLNAASYFWPGAFNRWLIDQGIAAEGGIQAVLDLSGYAYGDQWGDLALVATAKHLSRCAAHGRPYLFLPQAYGPFERTRAAAGAW